MAVRSGAWVAWRDDSRSLCREAERRRRRRPNGARDIQSTDDRAHRTAAAAGQRAAEADRGGVTVTAPPPGINAYCRGPPYARVLEAPRPGAFFICTVVMLAPRLPKQNPQARGALGGSCLELRPLRRVGVSGDGGTRRNSLRLAARHCVLRLPFGAMALHLGMRRFSLGRTALARPSRQSRKSHIKSFGSMGGNTRGVGGQRPNRNIS